MRSLRCPLLQASSAIAALFSCIFADARFLLHRRTVLTGLASSSEMPFSFQAFPGMNLAQARVARADHPLWWSLAWHSAAAARDGGARGRIVLHGFEVPFSRMVGRIVLHGSEVPFSRMVGRIVLHTD